MGAVVILCFSTIVLSRCKMSGSLPSPPFMNLRKGVLWIRRPLRPCFQANVMAEVEYILEVSRLVEPMSPFATRAKRVWADAVAAGLGQGGAQQISFVGRQQLHGKHVTQQEWREED